MSVTGSGKAPDGKATATWLDWRDSSHYGGRVRPCGSCGKSTPLLNDSGSPQHKVCAQSELDQSKDGAR